MPLGAATCARWPTNRDVGGGRGNRALVPSIQQVCSGSSGGRVRAGGHKSDWVGGCERRYAQIKITTLNENTLNRPEPNSPPGCNYCVSSRGRIIKSCDVNFEKGLKRPCRNINAIAETGWRHKSMAEVDNSWSAQQTCLLFEDGCREEREPPDGHVDTQTIKC